MFSGRVRISVLSALLLVVLRIAVGWHFLYEGLWKYKTPSFSSESFLRQSRGPWADKFLKLIPDYDGTERLNPETTAAKWDEYRTLYGTHYGLSQEQSAQASQILERRKAQLNEYLGDLKDDVAAYFKDLAAHQEATALDKTALEVPYQQKRHYDKEKEIRGKAAPWLAEVDRLTTEFKRDLDLLLSKDQQARGAVKEPLSNLDKIDKLTTYGLMAIGICLMVGLFTRLASLGGAVFLAGILLSQPAWPTIYPPLPPSAGHSIVVNKEFLEMLVLLAFSTMPVGRWAGVDAIIHYMLFGTNGSRGR